MVVVRQQREDDPERAGEDRHGKEASPRLHALRPDVDRGRLVAGLQASQSWAAAALYDGFAAHVTRVLVRILGDSRDIEDLRHDVFVRVLHSVHRVRAPEALGAWITRVAVNVAWSSVRSRMRRRWLRPLNDLDPMPEPLAAVATPEMAEAVRCTYALLDTLPARERVAFALRYVDGMELTEVAHACGKSLATVKRWLARAQRRFGEGARANPALRPWVEGGARWGTTKD